MEKSPILHLLNLNIMNIKDYSVMAWIDLIPIKNELPDLYEDDKVRWDFITSGDCYSLAGFLKEVKRIAKKYKVNIEITTPKRKDANCRIFINGVDVGVFIITKNTENADALRMAIGNEFGNIKVR